jgi:hypothetical protein
MLGSDIIVQVETVRSATYFRGISFASHVAVLSRGSGVIGLGIILDL